MAARPEAARASPRGTTADREPPAQESVHEAELAGAVESLDGAYIDESRPLDPSAARPPGDPGWSGSGRRADAGERDGDPDRDERSAHGTELDRDAVIASRSADGAAAGVVAEAPLTVGALAERLGIATSTLRSWDRRYGLGPSDHRAGDRRRYGPADVVRLERMRALTLSGVSPSDAARAVTQTPTGYGTGMPVAVTATSLDVQSLAAAAAAGDRNDVRLAVSRHVEAHGWTATWQRLLSPTCDLLAVGAEPQAPGSDGITVLTGCALEVVRTTVLAHGVTEPVRVAVHTTPKHVLAAHVLAGALAERGVLTLLRRVGRSRVPDEALSDIVDRTPDVGVVVGFGRAASVRALAASGRERRPEVVLVGPGLPRRVPPEAILASDLPSAVSTVTALLEGADLA